MSCVMSQIKKSLLALAVFVSCSTGLAQQTEVQVRPIYNWSSSTFHGTVNLIAPGMWITAAHVASNFTSLDDLALSLMLDSKKIKIYQPKFDLRYLDLVIVTEKSVEEAQAVLTSLFVQNVSSGLPSFNSYTLESYSSFASFMTKSKVSGPVIYTQENSKIYLAITNQTTLNWGSSGALVFSPDSGGKAIGLAQCVLQVPQVASTVTQNQSTPYVRALSSTLIHSSPLEAVLLPSLRQKFSDYELQDCEPIDAKRGGGG